MAERVKPVDQMPAHMLGYLRVKRVADRLNLPMIAIQTLPLPEFVALEALLCRGS